MKGVKQFEHIEDLDTESKYLVHKAKDAAQTAYAPYSKFYVGAALILDDGTLVTGSNQENASYPLCMCAERVALYSFSAQYPAKKIKKLAVVAHKKNHKELIGTTPCGACRQVIFEFEMRQKRPIVCIFFNSEGKWMRYDSVEPLLPDGFTADSLPL